MTSGGAIQCWTLARSPAPWPVPTTVGVGIASCVDDVAYAVTDDGRIFVWHSGWPGPPTPQQLGTAAPVAALTGRALRTTDGRAFDLECGVGGIGCTVGAAWPGVSDAEAIWTGDPQGGALGAAPTVTDCVRHVGGVVDCRFAGRALTTLPPLLGIATPAAGTLVHVPVLDGALELVLEGARLCARAAAGGVTCWGDPDRGRLGSNDTSVVHTTPVASGAEDLAMGRSLCALRAGRVVCWGLTHSAWSSGALCPPPLDRALTIP